MNWRKHVILAALVAALVTAAPGFGQVKAERAKQDRASVLLRFAKDGTVSSSCSVTLGVIQQSMLQLEGVKNVKADAKNNGIQVSYDPRKTTPQKIAVAFNKENPDTLVELPDTRPGK
jgi:hypothetical protein